MRKDLKEKTIRKFKGINASRQGVTNEAFGPAEDQLIDISNWNISPGGYLERRPGAKELCTIPGVAVTNYGLRIIGTQRGSYTSFSAVDTYLYLLVTDTIKTWRVNVQTGAYVEVTYAQGTSIPDLKWAVEYGGTNQPYWCFAVRWNTSLAYTAPGIIQINPDKNNMDGSTGFAANTPIGTHMVIFKDRLFVINTEGSTQATGNETKVWFSNATTPLDFGGAGATGPVNNFNLDFGDGDMLCTMIPFNDQLYCFKTKKTYVVGADGDTSNWTYKTASERIGCVGRGTVKIIDGKLYFLSMEGVVRFDGARAELISENVKDLLETHRDYKYPYSIQDMYASHWNNKYILWMPRDTGEGFSYDSALVFDIKTEAWTRWNLTNNVQACSEAKFSDLTTDSLFVGTNYTSGAKRGKIWQISKDVWTDDGVAFSCSFQTKKLDFGAPMSFKRLYAMGMTIKNEPTETGSGSYSISTTADDNVNRVHTLTPPTKYGVTNIKIGTPRSSGRYFKSTVSLNNSVVYAAIYDMTWLAEERGIEPYSRPGGSLTPQLPATNVFTAGPSTNDRLTSGYVLG